MQEREGLEATEHRGEVEKPAFGVGSGSEGVGPRGLSDAGIYALGEEAAG